MRVLHIAGTSGSGKTTFIRALIPLLELGGATAVVKHLGHHDYLLEAGKDTTLFFGEGATASAGVDSGKTVLVFRKNSLAQIFSFLSSMGTRYVLVEGWKTLPLPKVVIGALPEAGGVVHSNPTVDQVLESLEKFPLYYSLEGLTRELQSDKGQKVVLAGSYPVRAGEDAPESRREFYLRFSPMLKEISRDTASCFEGVQMMLHLHQGLWFDEEDAVLMAVRSESPEAAIRAFTTLQGRLLSAFDNGSSNKG